MLRSNFLDLLPSTYVLQNIRFYPSILNVTIFLSNNDTEKNRVVNKFMRKCLDQNVHKITRKNIKITKE